MSVILTGLDLHDKARRVRTMLFDLLGGEDQFDDVTVELVSGTTIDAPTNEAATGRLRIVVKGHDESLVGRKFSQAVVALTLASVPGFFADTPPTGASTYGVYWPALIHASVVEHKVVLESGEEVVIAPAPVTGTLPKSREELDVGELDDEPTTLAILGDLCGARSGDKGGNANVGIWAADDEVFSWMMRALDVDTVAELLAVDVDVEVRRTVFPKMRAINYVVVGILGEGVASSTRLDPQGKGLGEYLRSRMVDVPISLLSKLRQP
jgi:hypothetical protein